MYDQKVLKEIVKEAGKDRVKYLVFKKDLEWLKDRGMGKARERLIEQLGKLEEDEYDIRGTCAYYGPVEEKDAEFKIKRPSATLRHILKMLEQGGEFTPKERRQRRLRTETVSVSEDWPSHLHPETYGIGYAIKFRKDLKEQGLGEKSRYVYPTIMVYNPKIRDLKPVRPEEVIWRAYGLITRD